MNQMTWGDRIFIMGLAILASWLYSGAREHLQIVVAHIGGS